MLSDARVGLFCTCLILTIEKSAGFLDFWPFNRNAIATPKLNIIPETEGNLFYFKYLNETQTQPYVVALNTLLTSYDNGNRAENARDCNFYNPPTTDSFCIFDKNNLDRCSGGDFGYKRGSPCIFFTLSQKFIWLTFEGDTAHDKEFIGPISYFPHRGFPAYYFPFTNVNGYQSPIVAVHFERPMRGVVITIECKAWAKNIHLDRENAIGYAKFHLLID